MKVAVVGVTGLVGTRMVEVLEERNFPVDEFIPVASGRSAGKKVSFRGKEYSVVTADEAITMKPDLALFSAGADISKEYAPKFAAVGCRVVDNSSCWRMDPTKKLVVPEINANVLEKDDYIKNRVKKDDEVLVDCDQYGNCFIKHGECYVGKLSKESGICNAAKSLRKRVFIKGFYVSDICVWTYQDTIAAGKKEFLDKWESKALGQGYIYVVQITGIGFIE